MNGAHALRCADANGCVRRRVNRQTRGAVRGGAAVDTIGYYGRQPWARAYRGPNVHTTALRRVLGSRVALKSELSDGPELDFGPRLQGP